MFNIYRTIKFGRYYQGRLFFGKKIKTPIEWYILDREGNKFLLLSKYCIDKKEYNYIEEPITWEKSSIRNWLNNEKDINDSFILMAFSKEELKKIVKTELINSDNVEFNTKGGNNTLDKIFLLSVDEYNKYLKNYKCRVAVPTKYLEANSTFRLKIKKTKNINVKPCWWLRSPGYTQNTVMIVNPNGELYPFAGNVNNDKFTLRVALWMEIT